MASFDKFGHVSYSNTSDYNKIFSVTRKQQESIRNFDSRLLKLELEFKNLQKLNDDLLEKFEDLKAFVEYKRYQYTSVDQNE